MSGITINAQSFINNTTDIVTKCRANALTFAKTCGSAFEGEAKSKAPWVDRRGQARIDLYGKGTQSGDSTKIELGGYARNYKKYVNATHRYGDYMELLEFDHNSRFAVVFPARRALAKSIKDNGADVFFKAGASGHLVALRINRDKGASRARVRAYRARQRAQRPGGAK